MGTRDTLHSGRNEILAAAKQHGAGNVRSFGSVARRNDTTESDIDLLIDFGPTRSLYDLVGLQLDIESMLGRCAVVVTNASLSIHLRERALAEAQSF